MSCQKNYPVAVYKGIVSTLGTSDSKGKDNSNNNNHRKMELYRPECNLLHRQKRDTST